MVCWQTVVAAAFKSKEAPGSAVSLVFGAVLDVCVCISMGSMLQCSQSRPGEHETTSGDVALHTDICHGEARWLMAETAVLGRPPLLGTMLSRCSRSWHCWKSTPPQALIRVPRGRAVMRSLTWSCSWTALTCAPALRRPPGRRGPLLPGKIICIAVRCMHGEHYYTYIAAVPVCLCLVGVSLLLTKSSPLRALLTSCKGSAQGLTAILTDNALRQAVADCIVQVESESDRDYCPEEDTDSGPVRRTRSHNVPTGTRKASPAPS